MADMMRALNSKRVHVGILAGYLVFPIVAALLMGQGLGGQGILYFAPFLAALMAIIWWLLLLSPAYSIISLSPYLLTLLAFDALLIGTAFFIAKRKNWSERLTIILVYMFLSEVLNLAFSSTVKAFL